MTKKAREFWIAIKNEWEDPWPHESLHHDEASAKEHYSHHLSDKDKVEIIHVREVLPAEHKSEGPSPAPMPGERRKQIEDEATRLSKGWHSDAWEFGIRMAEWAFAQADNEMAAAEQIIDILRAELIALKEDHAKMKAYLKEISEFDISSNKNKQAHMVAWCSMGVKARATLANLKFSGGGE